MLTHALRMPNAKEVFFCGGCGVFPPPSLNEIKNTSFIEKTGFCEGGGFAPALAVHALFL